MKTYNMAFFEAENDREEIRDRLSPYGPVSFFQESINKRFADIGDLDIASVFIRSRVTKPVLERMPQLKLIATRSTGLDHIDLDYAARKGIAIANVPTYGENTVAEHTFAMILALSRNVHKANMRTMMGDFSLEGLKGFDLRGKTLGVIGAGHIGLHVIKMAKGFNMDVLAFDLSQNLFLAEVMGFAYADLDTILREADIITLHAPYNAATHHLINHDTLAKVKPGSLLINTSRGGLVDTNALVWALDEGILGGAGLDVLEGEELISEEAEILSTAYSAETLAQLVRSHILVRRENVVLTPHIAFYSQEAVSRILDTTIKNIIAFIEGRRENIVAPARRPKAA